MNPSKHIFHSDVVASLIQEAVGFFENTPMEKIPLKNAFDGSGVYALYYCGDFEHYNFYNKRKEPNPIYIGKAVPSGWRQGRLTDTVSGKSLYRRINEHTKSIKLSSNLDENDFRCRFMIFKDETVNLISTIESSLIRIHSPLWNSAIDGFGNHDPGNGRYNQAVSEWDFLHPGRKWVEKLTGQRPELERILEKIKRYSMRDES